VALLILEGAVRVFFPHVQDHVLPGRLFDIDESLGWKLKAGKQVNHRSTYFEVDYTTNGFGFRDRPRQLDKGTYRILLYGDSQVFGWGVAANSRFSNLLEPELPSGELWNMAVPAYGLDQQILSYKINGAALEANEVVFFVSSNTLYRSHHNYMYGKHKPVFSEDQDGALHFLPPKNVTRTRLFYEILSPLYFPHFIDRRLRMLRQRLEGDDGKKDRAAGAQSVSPGRRVSDFEKNLLRLAEKIAVERQHKMTILAELPKDLREDLRDFSVEQNVGFLAIDFDDVDWEIVLGRHDAHWNPRTHRLISAQLRAQGAWGIAGPRP
jgi:hypothetical protein